MPHLVKTVARDRVVKDDLFVLLGLLLSRVEHDSGDFVWFFDAPSGAHARSKSQLFEVQLGCGGVCNEVTIGQIYVRGVIRTHVEDSDLLDQESVHDKLCKYGANSTVCCHMRVVILDLEVDWDAKGVQAFQSFTHRVGFWSVMIF